MRFNSLFIRISSFSAEELLIDKQVSSAKSVGMLSKELIISLM